MKKSNLTRKEKLLFFSPALVLLIPLWNHFRGDRLDKSQRRLAGSNAINCGVGRIISAENNEFDVDRDEVDACAVAAFKARKPFIARYDTLGETEADSINARSLGITGTPEGKVYFSYYRDVYPWWFRRIRNESLYWRQAVCPQPKLYPHQNKARKMMPNAIIGCATCESDGSVETAHCILPLNLN